MVEDIDWRVGVMTRLRVLASFVRNLIERLVDRVLGVRTSLLVGLKPKETKHDDASVFESPSWFHLFWILRRVYRNRHEVTLLDYGCGSGRVLFMGCLLGFKNVIGVELNEELVAIARRNSERLRFGWGRRVQVFEVDACTYIPQGVTHVWLFNPFGKDTMAEVLRRIVEECNRCGRQIDIFYLNPQAAEIFELQDGCEKVETIRVPGFLHPTIRYRLSPAGSDE